MGMVLTDIPFFDTAIKIGEISSASTLGLWSYEGLTVGEAVLGRAAKLSSVLGEPGRYILEMKIGNTFFNADFIDFMELVDPDADYLGEKKVALAD